MKIKQLAQVGLGLTCAAFFLWLIIQQTEFTELKKTLQNTNSGWIIVAFHAFCLGYACRITRWHIMLKQDNPTLAWRQCAGPFLASFAINNLLPLRAGDLMRAFTFNQQLKTRSGTVLASLFVERLLDLLVILMILSSTLAWFSLALQNFTQIGSWVLALLSLLIIFMLLVPKIFVPFALVFELLITRFIPNRGKKITAEINKGITTLTQFAKTGVMLRLIFWSCLAWLAEGLVFLCVALALPDIGKPLASMLALPIGTLSTLIPSTPGYIGTFDYFVIKVMTLLGNQVSPSTAYALLVHALLWTPITLIGSFYLLLLNFRQSRH